MQQWVEKELGKGGEKLEGRVLGPYIIVCHRATNRQSPGSHYYKDAMGGQSGTAVGQHKTLRGYVDYQREVDWLCISQHSKNHEVIEDDY